MEHWHVDIKKENDTFFSLTQHVRMSPNHFFEMFLPKTKKVISDYDAYWTKVKELRKDNHSRYIEYIEFSDLKVFDKLLESLPEQSILQLGNSSTVRYVQLFDLKQGLEVYCNRGTSGIDGSTSTALGCSVSREKQTILISGDLSFFYDSNALWNNYIPKDFRIIMINNSGGGIFRILPGNKSSESFETYFETEHNLTASNLCEMYGFEYSKAANAMELEREIQGFYDQSERPKLLEIFTPRTRNDEILLEYFNAIR